MTTFFRVGRVTMGAMMAGALLLGSGSAFAQQASGNDGAAAKSASGAAASQSDPAAQATNRLREIRQQLVAVRKSALEHNPDLQEQRKDLTRKVKSNMREQGVDPDKYVARLREISKKLRGNKIDDKEQKSLAKEYRAKRRELITARGKAMNDKEIQQASKSFRQSLMAAMKKENPDVNKLLAEYRKAQNQLRQQMRESGQGSAQQDHG